MKAGASAMWASCCGLLNDVMGAGAVRGQRPFRFAPSAGYSTYPPTSAGSPPPACRACGQSFSVFRRRYLCCACRGSFCSLCCVLQGGLRVCDTCHLLRSTAFQRPRLLRLQVRVLRRYLLLRNVSTDTCREKEELVDLVLRYRGNGDDTPTTPYVDTPTPRPAFVASQEEPLSRSNSSDTTQDTGDATSVSPLPPAPGEDPPEGDPRARRRARPSPLSSLGGVETLSDLGGVETLSDLGGVETLSDLGGVETLSDLGGVETLSDLGGVETLSVRQLKDILQLNAVSYSGCCEKWELVERVGRLHLEGGAHRTSVETSSSSGTTDGERTPLTVADDNLCRICMDAAIDCVLLECGHMITCTRCGKRMSECPICRQYVVRAVHVFRS
ncbi:E3 ubiquitin-protein ligase RNF34a [Antennarius striatus]|uniref:E3 ubiquitin-protein ligase RNF34a n=1 Tax=Antennarius striatus TaxID=241820 RepID=UPI0035AEEB46